MKILKLHFKNINSLQGENLLDFNQAPLANAGVFAITGPNGSGKSSLLDVITLALYGETFKFDRPSTHVMTRHTTDCFAELEFQVHGVQYRCRWQAKREQEDEQAAVLPADMTLTKLDETETVLATDAAKVRAMVAEIIGLDFRNFTRSTLLAQGDFAAFLNALDSERLDILEKIISTDIYAEYQQAVIQTAEQERIKLESLHADLVAIPLLNAATQEAHEQDLNDFQAQLDDFGQEVQALSQQMSRLQTLAAIDGQHQQLLLQQQALQQQLQQIASDLQRIETSHAARSLQQDVEATTQLQVGLEADQLALTQYRQELSQLQAELKTLGDFAPNPALIAGKSIGEQQELIADLAFQTEQLHAESDSEKVLINSFEIKLHEKQAEIQTVKTWLAEHTGDASLLESFPDIGQLRKLNLQISDLQQQQKATAKTSKQTTAKFKNDQSVMQGLLKQVPDSQKKLATYEAELNRLLNNHQPEDLEELLLEQRERVKDYRELIALSKIQNRFKDSFWVRVGLVRPPQDVDISAINQQLHELDIQLLTEENIKKSLENAVFNESLLKKMHADRIHLVDNEPCPLCGALKHPYINQPPTLTDSKQALVDQTNRVQAINTAITKRQQQVKQAQKLLDNKQLKKDRLTRVHSDWAALCNRLNIASSDLSIDNPRPIKKLLNQQHIALKDIERVINNVRQYQKKIIAIKALIESQSNRLGNLQGIMQTSAETSDNRPDESTALSQALAQYISDEKQLSEKVMVQLAQLGEKMPPNKKKADALFNRLNQRRQAYQTNLLREKNLLEDIADLQQRISASQTNLAAYTNRLNDSSTKLQREQSSGLHLAVIEKQKLINEKELKIAQLTAQQQTQQQALQAQASQFGLQSYSDLCNLLQLLPQQAALQQQRQALETQLQQLARDEQALLDQKQAEQALVKAAKSLAEYEAEHHGLLEKMDIARLEIQRLEDLLAKQQAWQEKYTATLDRITEQKARFEQANTDLQQLTAEQGHAFRRKVQRQAADKLLSKTNQILEKISGRFYVRQGKNEQGLALEVEDTFQQSTRRLPKTLSGGESFVVSLALALGLSELASNGQAIESLFLDEGFGNLDAETLYTVVSTLESLQTQGKKVGVISHVDGVRKRIKTQIEMRKKPNGLSEFRVLV